METPSYINTLASEATFGADMLAHAFFSDNNIEFASPSLSVLSTPQLDFLGTPDTVISHDFGGSSPKMACDDSFDTFGHDRSIFEDNYLGTGPFFGDATLFASEDMLSSSALLEKYESNTQSTILQKAEVFVDASALSLPESTESQTSAQLTAQTSAASPAAVPSLPSFSRSSSNASFAVPKLPRGRKRKTVISEEHDVIPKKSVGKLRRTSPCIADEEEDDEKAALRAKNTEAAARSRARKRAAMEAAEQRICELEEENRYLKTLISQKDASLASYGA